MKGRTNQKILKSGLQRRLRSNMTEAELRLWQQLRRKQLGNFKFRRQHPFGDFILDFVCLEAMLAIEVDGGQHAASVGSDGKRTEQLQRSGFRVLRFWNNDVLSDTDSVMQVIWNALQGDAPPPSQPSP